MKARDIESRARNSKRYAIRIYKMKYSFENYDDYIYKAQEDSVNTDDILLERRADNKDKLISEWNTLFYKYEGFTYCVKDIDNDMVITGGVFDPVDIEYIEDYFN